MARLSRRLWWEWCMFHLLTRGNSGLGIVCTHTSTHHWKKVKLCGYSNPRMITDASLPREELWSLWLISGFCRGWTWSRVSGSPQHFSGFQCCHHFGLCKEEFTMFAKLIPHYETVLWADSDILESFFFFNYLFSLWRVLWNEICNRISWGVGGGGGVSLWICI